MKRWLKVAGIVVVVVVVLLGVASLWAYRKVTRSLPLLDGEVRLAGLAAEVSVDRDALGVPTIRAQNREDLARALGFLHAQDRFFQMDLMRRQAAGELAEVVGPAMVDADRSSRLHRFRWRARAALEALSPIERRILSVYTEGVNQGLAALAEKPFEYLLLGSEPSPWLEEDSFLVIYSMYFVLEDAGPRVSRPSVCSTTFCLRLWPPFSRPGAANGTLRSKERRFRQGRYRALTTQWYP